jgi:RND superfamily putative drug exporter
VVLVPATMRLLGDANWWIPGWLDQLVPNLDIEGETRLPAEELEQPQAEAGDDAGRVPAPIG